MKVLEGYTSMKEEALFLLFKEDWCVTKVDYLQDAPITSRRHSECPLYIAIGSDNKLGIFHIPATDIDAILTSGVLEKLSKEVKLIRKTCVLSFFDRSPIKAERIHLVEREVGINPQQTMDVDLSKYVPAGTLFDLELNEKGISANFSNESILIVELKQLLA